MSSREISWIIPFFGVVINCWRIGCKENAVGVIAEALGKTNESGKILNSRHILQERNKS